MENGDAPPSTRKIITVASIAAGVQFGWALQLSLLTPYVQQLGVPHMWASFIWLCGPLSGLIVQPIAGYWSDNATSKLGRRRPFILTGASFVVVAVILIGFAADIGHSLGDSLDKPVKPRAVAFFVLGFWLLDVANNTLQGPCRALLADLSGGNHRYMRIANSCFSFFMAIGNILGYAAGSLPKLYKAFPFTITNSCDVYCANLKSCFLIDVVLLIIIVAIATTSVKEIPLPPKAKELNDDQPVTPFGKRVSSAFKGLNKPMWLLYLVTAFNWVAWFPWILYDTDWMGREVYGGQAQGSEAEKSLYDKGVHVGSLGLMLNSVALAVASTTVEPISKLFGGVKRWWGIVNFILAIGLILIIPITKAAEAHRAVHGIVQPSNGVRGSALALFTVLGIPLAVTYSIPFALASIFSSSVGGGQGLSLGLLNLAIVIPQMIVSVVSGWLDKQFGGGGNMPAFVMGAIAAFISGIMALFVLPDPPSDSNTVNFIAGGGH